MTDWQQSMMSTNQLNIGAELHVTIINPNCISKSLWKREIASDESLSGFLIPFSTAHIMTLTFTTDTAPTDEISIRFSTFGLAISATERTLGTG